MNTFSKKQLRNFSTFTVKGNDLRFSLILDEHCSPAVALTQKSKIKNRGYLDFSVRDGKWQWSFNLYDYPHPSTTPTGQRSYTAWKLSLLSVGYSVGIGTSTVIAADLIGNVATFAHEEPSDEPEKIPVFETYACSIERYGSGILADFHQSFQPIITLSNDENDLVYEIVLEGLYTKDGLRNFCDEPEVLFNKKSIGVKTYESKW
ncbi:MAG: hypothetical protein R3A13_00215 [Bdellovibrionota bacterium]